MTFGERHRRAAARPSDALALQIGKLHRRAAETAKSKNVSSAVNCGGTTLSTRCTVVKSGSPVRAAPAGAAGAAPAPAAAASAATLHLLPRLRQRLLRLLERLLRLGQRFFASAAGRTTDRRAPARKLIDRLRARPSLTAPSHCASCPPPPACRRRRAAPRGGVGLSARRRADCGSHDEQLAFHVAALVVRGRAVADELDAVEGQRLLAAAFAGERHVLAVLEVVDWPFAVMVTVELRVDL